MGLKIMWGGMLCIVALSQFVDVLNLVGAILMSIGYLLYLFDK